MKRREEEEEKNPDGKKDEWLYRRCASFNKMINNQSARCFIHHFDLTCFVIERRRRKKGRQSTIDC
jgi:hypothetical protein